MGRGPLTGAEKAREEILKQAEFYFEPLLYQSGLSENQILSQTLPELYQSLENINEIIKHPSSFGVFKMTSNVGVVLGNAQTEVQLGALPILLERKTVIIDRIRVLEGEQNIEKILNKVEESSEPGLKQEIEKIMAEAEKLRQLSKETEQERLEAQAVANERLDWLTRSKEEREAFKEKWEIWRSFLERESVSTIIGAFLLIILTLSLIVASFTHITTSQILDNGFLVLLGYFFGQTVAKAASRKNYEDHYEKETSK